jgi:hypothetical protein
MDNKKIKTFAEYEGDLVAMSLEISDTIVDFPLEIPKGQIALFNEPVQVRSGGCIVAVGNQLREGQLRILQSDIPDDKLRQFPVFSPFELLGVLARLEGKLYTMQQE